MHQTPPGVKLVMFLQSDDVIYLHFWCLKIVQTWLFSFHKIIIQCFGVYHIQIGIFIPLSWSKEDFSHCWAQLWLMPKTKPRTSVSVTSVTVNIDFFFHSCNSLCWRVCALQWNRKVLNTRHDRKPSDHVQGFYRLLLTVIHIPLGSGMLGSFTYIKTSLPLLVQFKSLIPLPVLSSILAGSLCHKD